jgi:uncharacterized protein (DUF2252 family)
MGAAEVTVAVSHPEHAPVEDRAAAGREARKRVPRSALAIHEPPTWRRDPVDILEEQAATRLPDLVPIRYGRMASSPFAFFRGAAAIMAEDLAAGPHTEIGTQLCGDAHLLNFGIYNSPERRLVFDLNDFDETLPGPWEWDLKRLVASLVVAAQENGFADAEARDIVRDAVRAYRTAMESFAGMKNLELWYVRLEVDQLVESFRAKVSAAEMKAVTKQTAKFASRDSLQAFAKLTEETPDGPRFRSAPPLVVPAVELFPGDPDDVHRQALRVLHDYYSSLSDDRRHLAETYRYVDLARKVVGVGSVGTRAWMVLLLGRDEGDPLVLQVKEAQASVLERHLGASETDGHGHRVVKGQRLMQASSDIFLGWYHGYGMDLQPRDFYVRQLRDGKGGVDVSTMAPNQMHVYAGVCAWTLARAHARSGDRVAIAAYTGQSRRLDDAMADYAFAYAEQNRRDHQVLVDAISSGRVHAISGV